jgi:hypothetical protein
VGGWGIRGMNTSLFENSVIIIGAGASVPFGLQTGFGMMTTAIADLEFEQRKLEQLAKGNCEPDYQFLLTRFLFQLGAATDNKIVACRQLVAQLIAFLQGQTCETIDDLIMMNVSRSSELKRLVAYSIFDSLYTFREQKYALNSLANRTSKPRQDYWHRNQAITHEKSGRRNWIHQLINIARAQGVRAPNGSKIKIVSFNYDGILEHVLADKWNNAEAIESEYTDVFEIYHPHGLFEIPNTDLNFSEAYRTLDRWADSVRVVRETLENIQKNEESLSIKKLKNWVQSASDVYALGFAFANSNCELLGIKPMHFNNMIRDDGGYRARRLHFLNFDDSYGLRARAEIYSYMDRGGITSSFLDEHRPTKSEFLHLDEAISSGLLGEMPA